MDTTSEIIEYYTEALQSIYGADEATNMALMAIEDISGKDRQYLLTHKQTHLTLSDKSLLQLVDFVPQLQQNTPIQYVLGHAWFYDIDFKVDENVLIPRQETEELVDWILKDTKQAEELNILDIGTGSGCIPVSIATKKPKANVWALDISEGALKIAIHNAKQNKAAVTFIKADILDKTAQKNISDSVKTKLDIIVSNPPYVRDSEKKLMQANVLDFEPHIALFVKDDNALVFYEAIADFAKHNLLKGGKLYFEINEFKGENMMKMLNDKGFSNIELRKDLNGRDRMMRCEF